MAATAQTGSAARRPDPRLEMLREFWHYFSESRGAVVGLAVIVALILLAVFADLVAPYSPNEQFRDHLLQPPAWQGGGSWAFPLGTDAVGRDMLSRILHGGRYSLSIGCFVVSIALVMGVSLGLVAGFFRGFLETVIMRLMDVILAFPSLLLALVLVAILGPSLTNAMIAIAIVLQPHFVRLTRASVISELSRDYVTASRVAGAKLPRLMFVAVLPNCMAPLIVQATLSLSTAILDAAALGFLGMGAQPPAPEWGTLLADARDLMLRAWWTTTFPGLAILIAVLSFNLMGDGLRDALDPKLKRS